MKYLNGSIALLTIITGIATCPYYAFSADNKAPAPKKAASAGPSYFVPIDFKNPASVITAYFKLSALNRIQEASTLLGPIYQIDTMQQITAEMQTFSKLVKENRIEVNLLEIKTSGDWALAILLARTTGDDGNTAKSISEQYLIKLQDKWRVVPAAIRQNPGFSPFIDNNAVDLFQYWSKHKPDYEVKYLGHTKTKTDKPKQQ